MQSFEKSGTKAGTNSTKSPTSGAGYVSEPRLTSQVGSAQIRVRVDQRVSAARAVAVPVTFCQPITCIRVTEVGEP